MEVGLVAGTVVLSVVGYMKWRAYLRYLERAADRGNLTEAAEAASLYPDRDHGLTAVTHALRHRRQTTDGLTLGTDVDGDVRPSSAKE